MAFGYTPLDPLVVLIGTFYGLYLLTVQPFRLIGWMPAALSFYVFIPTVTLLTFWQTIPLILTFRVIVRGTLSLPKEVWLISGFLFGAFLASALGALAVGDDSTRAVIRTIYYLGIFALLAFSYEACRTEEIYVLFLKGLVVAGTILAVYGLYQIIAISTGLPFRGIVRGTGVGQIAFEAGLLRINSLASEPKRLGYVLFVCALACPFYAQYRPERRRRLIWTGVFIAGISLLTFSGSYFSGIALFALAFLILYPSRATVYTLVLAVLVSLVWGLFPDASVFEAISEGYERRLSEVEVGLDGRVVYRQEFYGWDYLENQPMAALFGVGLGQYFTVLHQTYGAGAGYNEYGGLQPFNSLFLELAFDFGSLVSTLFYVAMLALVLRLRHAGERFLTLALIFLLAQSLSVLNMHFIIFFAGVGLGKLHLSAKQRGLAHSAHDQIHGF